MTAEQLNGFMQMVSSMPSDQLAQMMSSMGGGGRICVYDYSCLLVVYMCNCSVYACMYVCLCIQV